MKKLLCLIASVAILLTALPACSKGQTTSPYTLYHTAATALSGTDSAAVILTANVTNAASPNSTTAQITEYRFLGNDHSVKLSAQSNGNSVVQAHYTYLDGVLYVESGAYGNEKWKQTCAKEDIGAVSNINIDMSFVTALPVMTEADLEGVTVMTDGSNRKITVSVPQSKLSHWITAISGVKEMDTSDAPLDLILIIDSTGALSEVYMKFQLTIGNDTVKVDLKLKYSDIGAQKPVTLPSDANSYREIGVAA